MGKATILEAQNSQTVYEEGKAPNGILGHLKGVFADYKNGTRNSDRLYTEELWDNRVFGSEDVMEALETKTLFGELDHPEGDRCETLAKNAAISIVKLEKRPEEGVIYGEAEILDTPTGRIVKALADSGAKLGISSRGMGEEVFVDGQNIIDPDTYDFITFDVVVTPANTKARVELTESKKFNKLTESFKKEIAESETENQLNQLKTVIESVNISNKDELVSLVENKLVTFKRPISNKLSEANRQIALETLKRRYDEVKAQLDESLKANESLSAENKQLVETKEFLENSRTMLKAKLKESNTAKNASDEQRLQESRQNKEIMLRNRQVANKKAENEARKLNEQIMSLTENLKTMKEKQLNNMLENKRLVKANQSKDEEIAKLQEANKEANRKIDEYSKILVENKKLLERAKLAESKLENSQNKIQESKILENKKNLEMQNRIKSLEMENKKLTEAQDRFSKLSFNPVGNIKAIAENFQNNEMDEDDIALFNALTGK